MGSLLFVSIIPIDSSESRKAEIKAGSSFETSGIQSNGFGLFQSAILMNDPLWLAHFIGPLIVGSKAMCDGTVLTVIIGMWLVKSTGTHGSLKGL